MSTHTMGAGRLLFGALLLIAVGAAGGWWIWGTGGGPRALVLRGGEIELEAWASDLAGQGQSQGNQLTWRVPADAVRLTIFRAETDDGAFVAADPIALTAVKRIHVDLKSANRRVEDALVLALQPEGVAITVKEGGLVRSGDIWVHTGFSQNGQRQRYDIAKLEFRDARDQVISRYQHPDLGRSQRFRLELSGSGR